jgi:hypothetical protein
MGSQRTGISLLGRYFFRGEVAASKSFVFLHKDTMNFSSFTIRTSLLVYIVRSLGQTR